MIPQIPAPALDKPFYQQREILAAFHQLYAQWRIEYELTHPAPPIENVRFEHDTEWRNTIFSLTCAREQRHWIWKATSIAFNLSSAVVAGGGLMALSPFNIAAALLAMPLVVRWVRENN